jgi:hypothetical protein
MTWPLFPSRWEVLDYSTSGWLIVAATALVAVASLAKRGPSPPRIVLIGALTTLAAHVLAIAILRVDPGRGSGTVPLGPSWFAGSAAVLGLALPYVMAVLVGAAGATALRAIRVVPMRRSLLWVIPVTLYAVWCAPWCSAVILD